MMFRHAIFLAIAALLLSVSTPLRAADAILDEVIAAARSKGINGEAPDWPKVEREAYALLADTPGESGRTAAIWHVLRALKDGHSFYVPPATVPAASGSAGVPSGGASPPQRPTASRRIATAHDTVDGIGHLAVHAWGGRTDEIPAATREVRDALNETLADAHCGLVIDVAHNGGGNMWPMMGGIAPLYDDGVLETFQGRRDERQVVNVHAGLLRMGDSVFPRVELPELVRKPRHVAILLGSGTMSSGEILALGFKGQRNVRFFGQHTRGLTTANRTMRLANGGMVGLTTARILDRTGMAHEGPVLPDETTAEPLQTARAWLVRQCAKR
jgi:hypothetical protein